MEHDYAFEMAASNIRYGVGATREVGMDLADLGVKRVMVLTDPRVRGLAPVGKVLDALAEEGIEYSLFDSVRIEPTDSSLKEAIRVSRSGNFAKKFMGHADLHPIPASAQHFT